jgi:dethiobiotin synthetase
MLATGTGVGKTYTTAAIARALRAASRRVVALKPVESGVEESSLPQSDAALLAEASGGSIAHCYALREPVSPHLAARRASIHLDLARLVAFVRERENGAELSLVESAGGVFSPLGDGVTNADFAQALARCDGTPTEPILVAPDRLGVLHEVHSTLLALKAVGAGRVRAVLLSAPSEVDASTGTNAAELERVVFPHLAEAAPLESHVSTVARGGDCELFVRAILHPLLG